MLSGIHGPLHPVADIIKKKDGRTDSPESERTQMQNNMLEERMDSIMSEQKEKKYAAAVDIGGTSTRIALVDEDYNVLKRVQFATMTDDPMENSKKIASIILSYDRPIEGIGISVPGVLDTEEGKIRMAANFGDRWIGFPLADTISELAQAPAWIANDANLAALAEAAAGEGKDDRVVQFLTISTGIGAGLIVDKEIYEGAHGLGDEVCNCILWKDGPGQGVLADGAVEAICSGTAITRRAREAGLEVNHAGEVNQMAVQGNEAAMEIMDDAKEYLANMIGILMDVSDPDIVVLGGSVAMKTPGFVEDVEKRVRDKVNPVLRPYAKVHRSTLSEDSGLIGAAALAFLNREKTKDGSDSRN